MANRAPVYQDDVDRIMAVMATAFDPNYNEAWTRAQVSGALLVGNCHYQLITTRGTTPDEAELLLFAVDPAQRRQGLGAQLLVRVKDHARTRGITRLLLEMRQGNSA